jgi:putative transposase
MRYSASDKTEIIRLVEQSPLAARRTLAKLGIPRSSFYRWYDRNQRGGPEALADRPSRPDRVWNRVPEAIRSQIVDLALDQPEARGNWRCASRTSKNTLSRRPRSIGC